MSSTCWPRCWPTPEDRRRLNALELFRTRYPQDPEACDPMFGERAVEGTEASHRCGVPRRRARCRAGYGCRARQRCGHRAIAAADPTEGTEAGGRRIDARSAADQAREQKAMARPVRAGIILRVRPKSSWQDDSGDARGRSVARASMRASPFCEIDCGLQRQRQLCETTSHSGRLLT